MTVGRHQGGGVILVTFLVALTLLIIPLPDWARYLRPDWVGLVLIYWCMAIPERIGVTTGWITGLFVDILTGTLIGQHALALTIVAWVTLKFHQRIRLFPVLQQAVVIMVLLVLHQLLVLWVSRIIGRPGVPWYYWAPSFTGLMMWPLVLMTLRSLRRSFHVN